jgi:hypothetical protein
MGQAGFQDWITAENVNEKRRVLDQRADQLQKRFLNKTPHRRSRSPPRFFPRLSRSMAH